MKSSVRVSRSSRLDTSARSVFGWLQAGCSTIAIPRGRCRSWSSTSRSSDGTCRTGTPIGSRILVERILPSRRGLGPLTAWEIVGVVVDEKASGLENPTDVGAYASFAQSPVVGLGLVARGSGDPAMLIKSIQQAVQRVNKYQVLDRPMTVTQLKADSMIGRRLPTYLLGGFALLAMLLACAGIYGVLSFVTAKRTQELGIRAALGARSGISCAW